MHVSICLGPFFQTINIPVFIYKVFELNYTGSCAQGKYNFEHTNKTFSRLCRKFPDLDLFVCFTLTRPYPTLCICYYKQLLTK